MSADPTDSKDSLAKPARGPWTFWQRIAQSLDRFVVSRSQRAVPAVALRRSKYVHDRCRRMLHGADA